MAPYVSPPASFELEPINYETPATALCGRRSLETAQTMIPCLRAHRGGGRALNRRHKPGSRPGHLVRNIRCFSVPSGVGWR